MCRAAGRNFIHTLESSMPVGKIDFAPLCGTAFRQTTQHLLLVGDGLRAHTRILCRSVIPFDLRAQRFREISFILDLNAGDLEMDARQDFLVS